MFYVFVQANILPGTTWKCFMRAAVDVHFNPLVSLAHALASKGLLCIRITCKGLNLTDRVKAYHEVWESFLSRKEFTVTKIFLAGKSAGAWAASSMARQLTAGSEQAVQGLVCLSFRLHPVGQTDHCQRSEDLLGLPKELPVLFLSGTADNMCEKNILENVITGLKSPATVQWIEGAGHGLAVEGRFEESVLDEINSRVMSWILERS
ncbi:testis-expressed protein 30 [Esox lucius]|uniref:testis-expressed protein 30 n=1 Tax=Esox lucius TaxID=8010 RepID=UPI001476F4CF|nr:testis-expressed protein 30 [Esox lucius]